MGFTILTSDAEAYSEKAKELIRSTTLAFAYDEFERIQRGPDGNPSQVGTLPQTFSTNGAPGSMRTLTSP